jgi:hypothetical protein
VIVAIKSLPIFQRDAPTVARQLASGDRGNS